MNFTPSDTKEQDVPYFEDAKAKDGWQGQATRKSLNQLEQEIRSAVTRLGGAVTNFQYGNYVSGKKIRAGVRIEMIMVNKNKVSFPARMDLAALPVRMSAYNRSFEKTRIQSLCMALYMVAMLLEGNWLFQQLAPGYNALIPFMITDNDETISERMEKNQGFRLLKAPEEYDFIEAETKELPSGRQ